MKSWKSALRDGMVSGSAASLATTLAVGVCGLREIGNAVAPINAVSHIAWGESAAQADEFSAKHTLAGLAINAAACYSWAVLYEEFFGEPADGGDMKIAMLGGAAVAGAAYVIDYHIVPKRLTPGFEKRLGCKSLIAIYSVLALSLGLSSLARKKS